jgi:threonine/homoserine/homoserine lactone efflux protein
MLSDPNATDGETFMPSTELIVTFLLTTAVFAYMPGPAMLYTSVQTIVRGRRAGWMAVTGLHLGGYIHIVATAFGLAALFAVVPLLFNIMKFVGAGYLCWLGLKFILARNTAVEAGPEVHARSTGRSFRDSIVVEILNPKSVIFYLAFLPQFTDPSAAIPVWAQFLILGTFVNVMFSSADVLCVILADKVTSLFRGSAAAGLVARRFGGGVLVALGVNLALQRQ